MKRFSFQRPFILIEIFIAIALLSLFALPMISYPLKSFRNAKEALLSLEKEMQAELIFYDLLLNSHTLQWEQITRKHTQHMSREKMMNPDGTRERPLYYHCHIYHCHDKNHPLNEKIVHVKICLSEKKEEKCSKKAPKFIFFAKKT